MATPHYDTPYVKVNRYIEATMLPYQRKVTYESLQQMQTYLAEVANGTIDSLHALQTNGDVLEFFGEKLEDHRQGNKERVLQGLCDLVHEALVIGQLVGFDMETAFTRVADNKAISITETDLGDLVGDK